MIFCTVGSGLAFLNQSVILATDTDLSFKSRHSVPNGTKLSLHRSVSDSTREASGSV